MDNRRGRKARLAAQSTPGSPASRVPPGVAFLIERPGE